MADGLRRNDTAGADNPGAQSPRVPLGDEDPAEVDEQGDWPGGGLPVVLLWLPYTALAALLLGLMIASFLRFHKKRLRKFQSRKDQLWRQLGVQEFLLQQQQQQRQQQQQLDAPPSNGTLMPPNSVLPQLLPSTKTPDDHHNHTRRHHHRDRREEHRHSVDHFDGHFGSVHQTHKHRARGPHEDLVSRGYTPNAPHLTSRPSHNHFGKWSPPPPSHPPPLTGNSGRRRLPIPPPIVDWIDRHPPQQPKCHSERQDGANRKRNSVVYITNINGSMVNLRCGEPEALDTFQGRRCFWLTNKSELCHPMRRRLHVDPSCLRLPAPRPEIWTTVFSYEQEANHYD